MRRIISISCILFLFTITYGQEKDYFLKFDKEMTTFKSSFKFAGIIDNRYVKQNVGFLLRGMNYLNVEAKLNGKFEKIIGEQVNKIIDDNENGPEVFLLIHELNVIERFGSMNRMGICRIKIEFIKKEDGVYYSLGTHSSVIQKGGTNTVKGHGNRILEGLRSCIIDFERSDWINNQSNKVVSLNESNSTFDFKNAPVKGMYASFEKMGKNEPMEDFEIQFNRRRSKVKSKKEIPKYEMKIVKKKDRKKKVMFISTGQDVFMHATRYSNYNYFLKAEHIGRYIYFEDKLSSPGMGLALGATGTVLSIKRRGIVLDTQTGLVFFLTDKNLYAMVKDHKDIVATYKNSKQKLINKKEALIALNQKY